MSFDGQTLLSIALGIGLAAAAGLRIFLPLLAASIAARQGWIVLNADFLWLASNTALLALGVAALLEIAAYYVPGLDHALDVVASPLALIAGTLLAAASTPSSVSGGRGASCSTPSRRTPSFVVAWTRSTSIGGAHHEFGKRDNTSCPLGPLLATVRGFLRAQTWGFAEDFCLFVSRSICRTSSMLCRLGRKGTQRPFLRKAEWRPRDLGADANAAGGTGAWKLDA